jgi:hypothetical protein
MNATLRTAILRLQSEYLRTLIDHLTASLAAIDHELATHDRPSYTVAVTRMAGLKGLRQPVTIQVPVLHTRVQALGAEGENTCDAS